MAADGANLGGFGDVSAFDLPADIPPFQTPEALEAVPGNVKLTGNFNLMAELFNYGSRHLSQDDRARRESLMNYDMESGALKVYLAGVTPSAIEAAKTMSEVFSAGYTVCTLPSELAYAFKFYKMAWPPAQVDPACVLFPLSWHTRSSSTRWRGLQLKLTQPLQQLSVA